MTLDNILEEIKKASTIVILTHENPDGDAIGSSLATYMVLKKLGKDVDVIIPEYPKVFRFLPYTEEIKQEGRKESYDLAISVDCATTNLLNGFLGYFEDAKVKVSIDHHSTNTMYADYNYINPDSPACAQVLLSILEYFGVEIDKQIGTCLLTGIITDTGGFQYQSTTAETFEFAAELLKKGVNVSEIYKKVMNTKTRESFELRKLAMNRLEFHANNKIVFTYITKQDMEQIGAENGDCEGIVEEGRAIEGVEVSIFLKEAKTGGFKCSLRSNDYLNVSDVCMMFGGGGHFHAAGCKMNLPFEQVKERIIQQAKLYIK